MAYLDTLRDVGAREGEAPPEASGSIRLMTIHKAKGLEVPVVVLADSARREYNPSAPLYDLPGGALALRPDRLDSTPVLYRLARWLDKDQSEAERDRLLYVALTRAQEKLIISGHCSQSGERWSTDGWLKDLLETIGVDKAEIAEQRGKWQLIPLNGEDHVGVWIAPEAHDQVELSPLMSSLEKPPASDDEPLFRPLVLERSESEPGEEANQAAKRDPEARSARPVKALGTMVHRALEHWLFPGSPGLTAILESTAIAVGLTDPLVREAVMEKTVELLDHFQGHPLHEEIENAIERHHEVPYTMQKSTGRVEFGRIDLLYRLESGWQLLDFKVEAIQRDKEPGGWGAGSYQRQIRRYRAAAEVLLGEPVRARLCILDETVGVRLV
jgi:ATP-dependent helicase/nuclease subunit A